MTLGRAWGSKGVSGYTCPFILPRIPFIFLTSYAAKNTRSYPCRINASFSSYIHAFRRRCRAPEIVPCILHLHLVSAFILLGNTCLPLFFLLSRCDWNKDLFENVRSLLLMTFYSRMTFTNFIFPPPLKWIIVLFKHKLVFKAAAKWIIWNNRCTTLKLCKVSLKREFIFVCTRYFDKSLKARWR